jgi:hypothetical protein
LGTIFASKNGCLSSNYSHVGFVGRELDMIIAISIVQNKNQRTTSCVVLGRICIEIYEYLSCETKSRGRNTCVTYTHTTIFPSLTRPTARHVDLSTARLAKAKQCPTDSSSSRKCQGHDSGASGFIPAHGISTAYYMSPLPRVLYRCIRCVKQWYGISFIVSVFAD